MQHAKVNMVGMMFLILKGNSTKEPTWIWIFLWKYRLIKSFMSSSLKLIRSTKHCLVTSQHVTTFLCFIHCGWCVFFNHLLFLQADIKVHLWKSMHYHSYDISYLLSICIFNQDKHIINCPRSLTLRNANWTTITCFWGIQGEVLNWVKINNVCDILFWKIL